MKQAILVFLLFFSSLSHAHDSFFAFAELEYKELQGKMEATISATAHDLEHYLQNKQLIKGELNDALKDSATLVLVSNELNNHFFVDLDPFGQNSTMDGVEFIQFHVDGFEIELNGMVRFYLSTKLSRPLTETIGITFNLLMDTHVEQQNKMTFLFREKKSTFVFLQNNQKQLIDLH
jgi:hypothetical protein